MESNNLTRIYIGLTYGILEENLIELFTDYNVQNVKLISEKEIRESKGLCFS